MNCVFDFFLVRSLSRARNSLSYLAFFLFLFQFFFSPTMYFFSLACTWCWVFLFSFHLFDGAPFRTIGWVVFSLSRKKESICNNKMTNDLMGNDDSNAETHCKNLCKQQPQMRQHQLHIYVRWNRERKKQQQQSNTTFGGKLIDFGAIQWLWKVLQRIINYLELDNTRTHTDTVELIRNISQSEQKNEMTIAPLETHFDRHRWSFFEFDFLILHAKYTVLLLGKGIHKNGWCSGLVNLNVLCQKLNSISLMCPVWTILFECGRIEKCTAFLWQPLKYILFVNHGLWSVL